MAANYSDGPRERQRDRDARLTAPERSSAAEFGDAHDALGALSPDALGAGPNPTMP